MHAKRKAHVVRMVVEDDDLKRTTSGAALDQRPAQMMVVTTAEKHGAVLGWQSAFDDGTHFTQTTQRAAEADRLLPTAKIDHGRARQGSDRPIEIKNYGRWQWRVHVG